MAKLKTIPVRECSNIGYKVTNRNRKWLECFEKKLMENYGVDSPLDVPNADIVNYAVELGYRRATEK